MAVDQPANCRLPSLTGAIGAQVVQFWFTLYQHAHRFDPLNPPGWVLAIHHFGSQYLHALWESYDNKYPLSYSVLSAPISWRQHMAEHRGSTWSKLRCAAGRETGLWVNRLLLTRTCIPSARKMWSTGYQQKMGRSIRFPSSADQQHPMVRFLMCINIPAINTGAVTLIVHQSYRLFIHLSQYKNC